MIPIVYHPRYNITAFGLEKLHPFDSTKYRRIRDELVRRSLRRKSDFVRPSPVRRAELAGIHTSHYLGSLKRPDVLARILEVPVAKRLPGWLLDWRILRPMRFATGGTILACRLALEHGLAVNLGGGFHHASGGWGGGFCVYADAPLAAWTLQREQRVDRVLVVDLDAHQGNGTAAAFAAWPWAFLFDLYQESLFPSVKPEEDYPIPLRGGMTGSLYLDLIRSHLPVAIAEVKPDLVIYNAGSDPYVEDPLSGLRLTRQELAERDLLVATIVREESIPLALILSGGYSAISWLIHADGIESIAVRFDGASGREAKSRGSHPSGS